MADPVEPTTTAGGGDACFHCRLDRALKELIEQSAKTPEFGEVIGALVEVAGEFLLQLPPVMRAHLLAQAVQLMAQRADIQATTGLQMTPQPVHKVH